MVDYSSLSSVASRILQQYGRLVTFVKLSRVPIDENKPWNGPDEEEEVELPLYAVFVPPNTVRQFGLTALGDAQEYEDLVERSQQILICNPASVDLGDYNQVIDGPSPRWSIIGLQQLRPGPTRLLAFVGLRR